ATVTNDAEIAERVSTAIYPVLSSNYDPARLGPLAIAAAEAIEPRPAWARLTIDLARELGRQLHALGHEVLGAYRGGTETHQLVLDVERLGGGETVMRTLERSGIAVGACRLPGQSPASAALGIRLGT